MAKSWEGLRPSRLLAAAAVFLTVVGVVAVGLALRNQTPAPPQPSASPAAPASPSTGGTVDDRAAPEASRRPAGRPDGRNEGRRKAAEVVELDYSRPVRISIPRIDTTSSLVELGLDERGVMETPEPVDKAGWFRPSPPPGIPGATVIAGHVNWNQAPMVFFKLGSLRPGDRVEVERADGVTTVFEVNRVDSFPKDRFPTAEVYDNPPRSELRLITCGGEYDESANRYLENIVVWAEIVGVRGA